MRRSGLFVALLAMASSPPVSSMATPPGYDSFGREQKIIHTPEPRDVLRVWIVFVEQGDGIIIQLPQRIQGGDDTDDEQEQTEVLVDGGSVPVSERQRISRIVGDLLPTDHVIEHAVLTHHDQDHVEGLTQILIDQGISISHIYHNGLASWRGGVKDFPTAVSNSTPPVVRSENRWMAFVTASGTLKSQHVVDNLAELTANRANFTGIYKNLATAVCDCSDAHTLTSFNRAFIGAPFIDEMAVTDGLDLGPVSFTVLWPEATLRAYASNDWGQTINGNSITFMMRYGEFEMLFTGDQNEHSEEALCDALGAATANLRCDVLKVPHHGSSHAIERFFIAADPVVGVCSMGAKGFQSKKMESRAWQHPSTDVVQWVGGAHRFYSTFIHERRFKWDDITTETKREKMIERTNILVETDGEWFRVVELPADQPGLGGIPSVQATRRGDGTRWIKAAE